MKKFMKMLNESFQANRSAIDESSLTVSNDYCDLLHENFDEDVLDNSHVEEELIPGQNTQINITEEPETISIDYMTIGDMLEGMHDNVSESELDRSIKVFKKVANIFQMKRYDEIIVCVDDGEYNPQYVFSDGEPVQGMPNLTYYPSAKLVCEAFNNLLYLYFATEVACMDYFRLAKKFLTDYELTEENFNKHDLNIGDSINIEEALNHRDANSYNKFDLLNKYLGEKYTDKQKYTIAKMLKENVSDEEIYNYMQELNSDEEALKNYYGVESTSYRSKELDQYLKDMAKNDYESGHPFDPYDFEYFKHGCKDDGYDVTEADFDKYFEYFDELRCQDNCDDNFDWFEDEE